MDDESSIYISILDRQKQLIIDGDFELLRRLVQFMHIDDETNVLNSMRKLDHSSAEQSETGSH